MKGQFDGEEESEVHEELAQTQERGKRRKKENKESRDVRIKKEDGIGNNGDRQKTLIMSLQRCASETGEKVRSELSLSSIKLDYDVAIPTQIHVFTNLVMYPFCR